MAALATGLAQGFAVVFDGEHRTFRGMSLNRSEQMVFDYIQTHPEERQYWVEKVRKTSAGSPDDAAAATALDSELWRYFEERSGVVSPFREAAQQHGLRRTSMRNLAEYVMRLWAPPRKKKPPLPAEK